MCGLAIQPRALLRCARFEDGIPVQGLRVFYHDNHCDVTYNLGHRMQCVLPSVEWYNVYQLPGRGNKKAQLSLTNPRDACEKFARFTLEQWGGKLYR